MERRSHFKSSWLGLSKLPRSPKPSVLVVVLVALCASVLVPLAGDPPLLDADPAAAHHCDQYEGDWAAVCELVHACTNSGGTVTGGRCVYPTTTTTTVAPWLTCKHGYDWERSVCKSAPPATTTTTTTVAPWLTCKHGYDWERSVCKSAPPTTTTTVAPWLTCKHGYDWERSVCKSAPPTTTTTTTTTSVAPWLTCKYGYDWERSVCKTSPPTTTTTTTTTTTPSRPVKPTKVTCDPKTGEHRHEGATSDTCHLDHTTANTCAHLKPPGQHLFGHDSCHSGHSHTTCPAGQAREPFPPAWIYKFEPFPVVFTHPGDVWNYEQPAWVEADAHTGCHKATFAVGTKLTIPWGTIGNAIKDAVTVAVGATEFVVYETTSKVEKAYPWEYKALYLVACVIDDLIDAGIEILFTSGLVLSTGTYAKYKKQIDDLKLALKASKKVVAIAGMVIAVGKTAFCAWGVDPFEGETTPTTAATPATTTTASPPTTLKPDPRKYEPRYFSEESKIWDDCMNAEYVESWNQWRAYCPKY